MTKEKDSRRKIQEKRGRRKKERLTKSDRVVVETLESERKKRDQDYTGKERKLKNEREKLIEVLSQCEQRYSYETWESMKLLRKCMQDEDGYRVKANQVGRREWSKGRVKEFEQDLRNYEERVPTYEFPVQSVRMR
jgi:hypothetical protein